MGFRMSSTTKVLNGAKNCERVMDGIVRGVGVLKGNDGDGHFGFKIQFSILNKGDEWIFRRIVAQ